MFLLHQGLPHLNHQHDIEHTHKAVAHDDNHSHHHDVPEQESPKKGFLDLFLEMHVHSVVSHEILLTHQSSAKQLKVKKNISSPVSNKIYGISIDYGESEKTRVHHPPNNYFSTYLSSHDSRGPPSLG